MRLHEVEVVARERFGDHALLRYLWPGPAPEPGQFVMARASTQSLDPFLPRPFFAHDHEDGIMSLLFEVRGRGTALLAEEDARLFVSAPLGHGFETNGSGLAALVGGGVWISPLKLLGKRLAGASIVYDTFLEIPATAPRAYTTWISESYPDATLVPTKGAPDPSRAVLDQLGSLERYATLYASGPAEMLDATKRAAAGTVPVQLALRERMACASGSCYGCAVPVWQSGERAYARVCVEGPVFPAEVLAW